MALRPRVCGLPGTVHDCMRFFLNVESQIVFSVFDYLPMREPSIPSILLQLFDFETLTVFEVIADLYWRESVPAFLRSSWEK